MRPAPLPRQTKSMSVSWHSRYSFAAGFRCPGLPKRRLRLPLVGQQTGSEADGADRPPKLSDPFGAGHHEAFARLLRIVGVFRPFDEADRIPCVTLAPALDPFAGIESGRGRRSAQAAFMMLLSLVCALTSARCAVMACATVDVPNPWLTLPSSSSVPVLRIQGLARG